jgi:chromosomal replication initiator protein
VEQLAARRGLSVQSDAVAVVAQRPVESVREIEGLLATLHAHQRMTGAPSIDGATARAALQAERAARPRKPPRLEVIVRRVTEAMHVDLSEVMGTSRHKRVVLARGVAAALARRLTTCSFPEIARSLGRPGHSGVIAATQRIEKMIESGGRCDAGPTIRDISIRDLLDRLTAELQNRPAR